MEWRRVHDGLCHPHSPREGSESESATRPNPQRPHCREPRSLASRWTRCSCIGSVAISMVTHQTGLGAHCCPSQPFKKIGPCGLSGLDTRGHRMVDSGKGTPSDSETGGYAPQAAFGSLPLRWYLYLLTPD